MSPRPSDDHGGVDLESLLPLPPEPGDESSRLPARTEPSDLWSLPETGTSPAEDALLAAWMGALSQGQPEQLAPADEPVRRRQLPELEEDAGPAPRDRRQPPEARTLLLVLVASAVVSMITIPILHAVAGFGSDGPAAGSMPAMATDVDTRVMVPGLSIECPFQLVKPRPDGSTGGVRGTCFLVGGWR
jgi:hypothetical protein